MSWFLLILAIILFGATVLLFAPVVLSVEWAGKRRVRVAWLGVSVEFDLIEKTQRTSIWGLWTRRRPLERPERERVAEVERPKELKKEPKKKAVGMRPEFGDLVRWRGLVRRLVLRSLRLFVRLLRAPRLVRADIDLRYGTGDAASTGMAWGWVCAAQGALGNVPRNVWSWKVTPDFERRYLAGHVYMKWRLLPVRPVWEAVRFASGLPYRELYRVWRTLRERKRECPTTT